MIRIIMSIIVSLAYAIIMILVLLSPIYLIGLSVFEVNFGHFSGLFRGAFAILSLAGGIAAGITFYNLKRLTIVQSFVMRILHM